VPRERFIVFFFLGHSNMDSRAKNPRDNTVNPRCWYLKIADYRNDGPETRWVPAQDDIIPYYDATCPGFHMIKEFAAAYPDFHFGMIKVSNAGGLVPYFMEGGKYYEVLDRGYRAVESDCTVGGVFCMMGFPEARIEKFGQQVAEDFPANTKKMRSDVRALVGDPQLPFMFGRYEENAPDQRTWEDKIKAWILELPGNDPVNRTDLNPKVPVPREYFYDSWHYSWDGYQMWATDGLAVYRARGFDFWADTGPVNSPPQASPAASPSSGEAPLTVAFDASGSSDPDGDELTYSWDFGDGSSGTGATVDHEYTQAGSYAARLTVSDGKGGSDEATVDVTVSPPAGGVLSFETGLLGVAEGCGSVALHVGRAGGSAGQVSVRYETRDGTAVSTSGLDYVSASGLLQWADGDAGYKTVTIEISDDSELEVDETFTVLLEGAQGAALGSPAEITVTIEDDEVDAVEPTIQVSPFATDQPLSGTITVAGRASDNLAVDRVEVLVDGRVVGTAEGSADWTFAWDTATVPSGPHTLTFRAVDARGLSAEESVEVEVQNGAAGESGFACAARGRRGRAAWPVLLLVALALGLGVLGRTLALKYHTSGRAAAALLAFALLLGGCGDGDGGGPEPDAITITAPVEGQVLTAGETFHLRWVASVDDVNVFFSDQGGAAGTWQIVDTVGRDAAGWQDYAWTVPNVSSSGCMIMIEDYMELGAVDTVGFQIQ
jgi:PKD repeat protein